MLARLCFAGLFRDVGKIVVEDDFGPVDAARDDEIRIHHAVVDVDHEIRIDPVIERALAFADCGGFYPSPTFGTIGLDCRQKRSPVSIV